MKALILGLMMVAFGLTTSVFAEGEASAPPANNAPAASEPAPAAPAASAEAPAPTKHAKHAKKAKAKKAKKAKKEDSGASTGQ